MKTTPITEVHIALGAKMVEFAGYNMPVYYPTGISTEHLAVRNNVGMFDVSHMGEFIIRGEKALDLVQKISSNDASKLTPGDAQYSCIPNDNGGIIDDMIVYRLFDDVCNEGEQAFMLVVNASNIEKDWNWINSKNVEDVYMKNISDQSGLLAIQGPKAVQLLQELTDVNLDEIEFYHFTKGVFAGIDNVLISATGYTGAGGFELYVHNDHLEELWNAIMEKGKAYDILPIGLGARDTLRLEKGYCLYGNDINDETSPLEAGLGWITKLKVEAEFSSKQHFIAQKEAGLDRKLVGFIVNDRRVPRHDYEIYNVDEELIGIVTSGTRSPSLEKPIGMGYVKKSYAKVGTLIKIKTGKKLIEAEVVKLPFL